MKYWGEAVRERFDPYLRAMADVGHDSSAGKFDDFVTNGPIPEINNFDQDAVKKQADATRCPTFPGDAPKWRRQNNSSKRDSHDDIGR